MELTGRSLVGYRYAEKFGNTLNAVDPSTAKVLPPEYYSASAGDVEKAVGLAAGAFGPYSAPANRLKRATFLRRIAQNLRDFGEHLVERAVMETGLAEARIRGERERACFQLEFFARKVEEGSWVDARIDHADPKRTPAPRPDLRSMRQALGPVAVFCAANFPLAFSVAGGDTASALAAGNPVVVLGHYSHPGVAEYAATAIRNAAMHEGLPEGVFSLLYDAGHDVARALVTHPQIKAVGFTGSRVGGTALMKLASSRPVPIPFYAEMSSVNPVFVLSSALARAQQTARDLHASATLGVGQFCTNPGLVFTAGDSADFVARFTELMRSTKPGVMLNRNIVGSYDRLVSERRGKAHVTSLTAPVASSLEPRAGACIADTAVFQTDVANWLADPVLQEEVFGPSTLLVKTTTRDQLFQIANSLTGNLTATILGSEQELREHCDLVALLTTKVGRVIFNGFPTGVEVCEAVVHGGPFPATSDGLSTSVGGRAIERFTRPVCYQDFPDDALPPELRQANPLRICRLEDGRHVLPEPAVT